MAYAEKLGWLTTNPFRFLKAGDSTNEERLEYVPPETVLKVIDESPLRWGLIIALGRFIGVRGSSELYRMEWEDVHWSSEGEAGWIAIRTKKNERHGRKYRQVPMAPIVEELLSRWFFQAAEGEARIFPGMKSQQNFAVMVEKLAKRAGVTGWQVPWYNLRKSFCSDLLEEVKDISYYERITDHTYAIARKHYQIMHKGRELRGAATMEGIFRKWEPVEHGLAHELNAEKCVTPRKLQAETSVELAHGFKPDLKAENLIPPGKLQAETPIEREHGLAHVTVKNRYMSGLAGSGRITRQETLDTVKYRLLQEKEAHLRLDAKGPISPGGI